MEKSTTFSAPILRYPLLSDNKKILARICFRVKTTDTINRYDIYFRSCSDGSSIIEGVPFTVSYLPVTGTQSLCIIIEISYIEVLITFYSDIFNAFQNTILTNPSERVYISLLHIYLEWFKIKRPKN